MQCICHSVLHDIYIIYNYSSHSAKRQSKLKAFQYFTETEPHKLLCASQTRWLSLHSCVSRTMGCFGTVFSDGCSEIQPAHY